MSPAGSAAQSLELPGGEGSFFPGPPLEWHRVIILTLGSNFWEDLVWLTDLGSHVAHLDYLDPSLFLPYGEHIELHSLMEKCPHWGISILASVLSLPTLAKIKNCSVSTFFHDPNLRPRVSLFFSQIHFSWVRKIKKEMSFLCVHLTLGPFFTVVHMMILEDHLFKDLMVIPCAHATQLLHDFMTFNIKEIKTERHRLSSE